METQGDDAPLINQLDGALAAMPKSLEELVTFAKVIVFPGVFVCNISETRPVRTFV